MSTLKVMCYDSFGKAYREFLKDLLENGTKLVSAEKRWVTKEFVGHSFCLTNPRNRIIGNGERKVNLYQYIGQFLWILQGNYHVPDISYYVDAASRYTSDNIRNTGAYGFRLFGPGYLNQINDTINLLSTNTTSRRAVASIYMPHFDMDKDNHTGSEIPCTLNLQFLIREKKMDLVAYMRSQDVHRILPYDVFLFTMLQEYVAAILNIDVGNYYHMSGSFHIYKENFPWIRKTIKDKTRVMSMPPMPREETAYHFDELNIFENTLRKEVMRNQVKNKNQFEIDNYMEESEKMPEYWKQWSLVLMMRACVKLGNIEYLKQVTSKIKDPFKLFADRELKKVSGN